MYDYVFLDAFFSMPYSQEALPVIFSNETAVLGCSVFVLKTMCKTCRPKREPQWECCEKFFRENVTLSPYYHAVEG